jgi:hypothetical protein
LIDQQRRQWQGRSIDRNSSKGAGAGATAMAMAMAMGQWGRSNGNGNEATIDRVFYGTVLLLMQLSIVALICCGSG